jgi:hypothetical protein
MITAMTLLTLLIAIAALAAAVWAGRSVLHLVRNDGYGRPLAAPRSHHADLFDPRNRFA